MKAHGAVLDSRLVLGLRASAVTTRFESPTPSGLHALGRLMIGTWQAPGARQIHEWGVGRRLIRSRGYFPTAGEWQLVSEGVWYWDDEDEVVRGLHVAVEMPVDRFDYWTVVEGSAVTHDLRVHGEHGGQFVETWTFDGDGYTWSLERPSPHGLQRVRGGKYHRAGRRVR